MESIEGRVVTENEVVGARLGLTDRIVSIEPCCVSAGAPLIVPGFVDLHVHGGGGGDTMRGVEGLRQTCRHHLRHGTTALLATTVTAPLDDLEVALVAATEVQESPRAGEAGVLGVHLEGPFISPAKLGAQPPFARQAQRWEVERLLQLGPIRVMTLAPEVEGAGDLLAQLLEADVRPQIGHTTATYEQARTALDAGAAGFTHLYNAMSGMHQRAGGTVAAALAHAAFAEIIVDFQHVTAGTLLTAFRSIPHLYAVTDAVACCGLGDGSYRLGRQTIYKRGARVSLKDGTLAGSVLTMDQALRNLLSLGLQLPDAVKRLSTYPASYLGFTDRGRIELGARADLVVLDGAFEPTTVRVGGNVVYSKP